MTVLSDYIKLSLRLLRGQACIHYGAVCRCSVRELLLSTVLILTEPTAFVGCHSVVHMRKEPANYSITDCTIFSRLHTEQELSLDTTLCVRLCDLYS